MATNHACQPLITADDLACCIGVPDAVVDEAIDAASDMIYLLAPGMAVGRCSAVVRPCNTADYGLCAPAWVAWTTSCGCGMNPCGCCDPPGITLPGIRPVVTEVLVDGEAVPSDSYTMIDAKLVRFFPDGSYDHWPTCQSLTLPATEVGTFQVTYTHGLDADMVIRHATQEIACDLLAPWRNDRSMLPRGTTSANMNGVSVSINPTEVNAATFPWLARFLTTYRITDNGPATVWSPELIGQWELHTRA